MHLLLIMFVTLHDVYSMENGISSAIEYSFVVSVRRFDFHICSGIIINERNILTTAHTVNDISTKTLTVAPGATIYPFIRPSKLYSVAMVYLHPQFRKRSIPGMEHEEFFENDIAVLRLKKTSCWPDWIEPALLMTTEPSWGPCLACVIASWSHPTQNNMQPMKLQWDFIKHVPDEVSQLWMTHLLENQRGFNDIFERDAISSEDLGSPIICDNHVIGIVVKGGDRLYPEKPSTLLFIYRYLEFIWEIVTDNQFDIHPWRFPYVISIWNRDIHLCGGFIVDANHIATTGTCVNTIDKNNLRATVGYTDVDISDATIDWLLIKDVEIHPRYNVPNGIYRKSDYPPYDLAILTLSEPLVWSSNVLPLVMAESDNFDSGQVCQVLRWKPTTYLRKTVSITLKRSLAIIWDEEQLRNRIRPENSSFWARTPYVMPIAEKTDGGNPILCGDYPVGIVLQDSYPRKWNGPKSARFLKIRPFTEFIDSVTSRI